MSRQASVALSIRRISTAALAVVVVASCHGAQNNECDTQIENIPSIRDTQIATTEFDLGAAALVLEACVINASRIVAVEELSENAISAQVARRCFSERDRVNEILAQRVESGDHFYYDPNVLPEDFLFSSSRIGNWYVDEFVAEARTGHLICKELGLSESGDVYQRILERAQELRLVFRTNQFQEYNKAAMREIQARTNEMLEEIKHEKSGAPS